MKETFNVQGVLYTKITKTQLKALLKKLDNGAVLKLGLLPNKVAPGGVWVSPYIFEMTKEHLNTETVLPDGRELTFLDNIINSYSYYNCNNELGNRVSYYIVEG